MPQNQKLYADFQQTITMLNQQKANLERDIGLVEDQLENMRRELSNLDQSIILHTGGMSSIEVFTQNGYAIVKYEGEVPLALNPYQANQQAARNAQSQQPQVAPSQQQYQQQPTQTAYAPPPAITPQAQAKFAPTPPPMVGMDQGQTAPPPAQWPQIVQGQPPQAE